MSLLRGLGVLALLMLVSQPVLARGGGQRADGPGMHPPHGERPGGLPPGMGWPPPYPATRSPLPLQNPSLPGPVVPPAQR